MSKNVGQRAFHNARNKKQQKAEAAQLFERAVALQRAGLIPDSYAVCRQLLALSPRHFDALCLLGMFEYRAQRYQEAEAYLSQAIDVEPRSAMAHLNRGAALLALQRFEEAAAGFRRAIALDPRSAAGFNNLGNVCRRLNRFDEALANYDKALAIKPDFPNAWYNRGLVLGQLGRHEEALGSHDRALTYDPRYVEALNGRGIALRALGRPEEALDSADRALAVNPKFVDALNNRGNTLRMLERTAEALSSYDSALAIDPNFAEAHNGRGVMLSKLRNFDAAVASFQRALAIRPNYAEALSNLAAARLDLRAFDDALSDFEQALALAPGLVEAWIGRGNALQRSKQNSEAIACFERALVLDPASYRAHTLMGVCFAGLGRVEEAIAKFDEALAIKPDFDMAISLRVFVFDFVHDADFAAQRDARKLWWDRIGAKLAAAHRAPHVNVRDPNRRLVLGYVSSDFRNHSAALAFRPVLQYCDKAQFELVCYSCSPISDWMTDEFKGWADRWRDASQWSDDRLADQIRNDGVDILVDLSGHTDGHRLAVFARKPAPIQVHGWGHGTPPGLPTIDYVFSDPVTIPAEARGLFHEAIYDLPCMLTLSPLPPEATRAELPALANGFITFGAFNRISKISDHAVAVWAQILDRVQGSRLLVKDHTIDDAMVRDSLLARFARHGIAPERIGLLGATSRVEHLMALNQVDIGLDTFPQNGGVSTWEALQMGVPVVASLGCSLAGRASGGILSAVGMTDWVAPDPAGYLDVALTQAADIDKLAALRRDLPGRIARSAAGNPVTYAAEAGKAYRDMWQTWCAKPSG
jgi:predicted O-linked N-acetylglucosamine transferase (SPINDLY family)